VGVLGLFGGNAVAAPGADVRDAPVASIGPLRSFAIADFDGDQRPDIASVEAGRSNSSFTNTNYWIRLQLSGAGRQYIQLVAPAGGLLIEARDVNGDHAVDLVLATAWLRQPVAIFLNDGHGSFSRVEPTAFPEAFTEATANWAVSSPDQASDAVSVPPQPRSGMLSEATNLPDVLGSTESVRASNSGFVPNPFVISHAGRAPPSEILHS